MPPVQKVKIQKDVSKPSKTTNDKAAISVQLNKKLKWKQRQQAKERGVVFIKNLPHGFFEEQLRKYFEQFGKVTQVRLARSRRTGGSRGFAFVEFDYPEVAQVAAETMDNYLMFKKVVKASYIPPEMQQYNYFKTSVKKVTNKAGKDIYVSNKTAAIQRKVKRHNNWSDDTYQKRTLSKLKKVKKLNEKYAHLGVDFTKIIFQPTQLQSNGKSLEPEECSEAESSTNFKNDSKNRVIPGKNRVSGAKQMEKKKKKQDIELEDLLGNTINDDSEDEDYIANFETDSEEDTQSNRSMTDEEGSVAAFDEGDSDDDNNDIDMATNKNKKLKSSKMTEKSKKLLKTDPLERLIKRKPLAGGINKLNKKKSKKLEAIGSNSLKVIAAKKVAKPLSGIKHKSIIKAKALRK